MPTLIRKAGFEVRIYTLDHPPAHVHVGKAGALVKIALDTCEAVEIVGRISDRDVKRAKQFGSAKRRIPEIGVGEASWQTLRSPHVTVSASPVRDSGALRARSIHRPS